jgi:multicomponent Na+:H+ antiporter subunit E
MIDRVGAAVRVLLAPRRIVSVLGLVIAWCALWGDLSTANVVSGLAVAAAAILVAGVEPGTGRIRVLPFVAFVWLVAVDLVTSTVAVAWEIVVPADHTDEVIIAVDTELETRAHLLMLVVAITVTPGTAVVETDGHTGRLYLHLLHGDKAGAVTAHVQRLAALACRALPIDSAVAA